MKSALDIRDRDSNELNLSNFIVMPPSSKVNELGLNILHINTKNRPYTNNSSSAQFIEKIRYDNPLVQEFTNDSSTLQFAVETAMKNNNTGLFLEFGFCTGTSLNFIAALAYDRKVYGFDSIKGLKTNWRTGFKANVFAYKDESRFPFVPLANASLVIGWIEDTLPAFVEQLLETQSVNFIHIDTDSYDSAKFILDTLREKIIPQKTVVALDEGYNFSDTQGAGDEEWKKHEFLAINQFAEENNLRIEYLAYNKNHQQLIITFLS